MAAHRSVSATLVGLLLVMPPALANAQDYVQLLRYFKGDKPLFCFEVPIHRVKKLPQWSEKSAPPISRRTAIDVGAQQLRSTFHEVDTFETTHVDLNQVDVQFNAFRGKVWYYLIEYAAVRNGERHLSATDYIAVVLFDGKPVPKKPGDCKNISAEFAPNPTIERDARRSGARPSL